jgi:hypothetical protein
VADNSTVTLGRNGSCTLAAAWAGVDFRFTGSLTVGGTGQLVVQSVRLGGHAVAFMVSLVAGWFH